MHFSDVKIQHADLCYVVLRIEFGANHARLRSCIKNAEMRALPSSMQICWFIIICQPLRQCSQKKYLLPLKGLMGRTRLLSHLSVFQSEFPPPLVEGLITSFLFYKLT